MNKKASKNDINQTNPHKIQNKRRNLFNYEMYLKKLIMVKINSCKFINTNSQHSYEVWLVYAEI